MCFITFIGYIVTYIWQIRGQSLVNKNVGFGGLFGVGHVASIGTGVSNLNHNDSVIVVGDSWTNQVTVPAKCAFKLPSNLSLDESVSISTFVCASGILKSLPNLKEGDTIFQTCGTTAVGMAMSQLGNQRGIKVNSIIDDDLMEIKKLKSLGKTTHAVAGAANTKIIHQLTKTLLPNGAVVFYHGVYQPVSSLLSIDLPVSAAIFNNISVRGFDLAAWMRDDWEGFSLSLQQIINLMEEKKLSLPSNSYHISDYRKAFEGVEAIAALSVIKFK